MDTTTNTTSVLPWILLALGLFIAWRLWRRWQRRASLAWLERASFPSSVKQRLREEYPAWDERQLREVESGLLQYFRICARWPRRFVAMPSKAVDAAWHAFILDTRAYARFCDKAFGRMLHHTPAESLPEHRASRTLRQGLRRAWVGACRDQRLNPRKTDVLPLLFLLDISLGLPGGYRYVPDCRLLGADRGDTHCAADLGCGGGGSDCGGGLSWSSDGGDGGGSDGGGDGGSSCGSSCGGGGD